MKRKLILLTLGVLLFSSCIVKSIQPFYTTNTIKQHNAFVGNWKDNKSGEWEIVSFKDEWEKENQDQTKLLKEDKEAYERYKNSYHIKQTRKENEAFFLAMPFMVDNHLFLDFSPFEYDSDDLNRLAGQHLLKTHSAAYAKVESDNTVTLKWLNEKVIRQLLDNDKVRLKHEKTGIDDDLILTANSEQLHNFLKKFMSADIEDKWDNDVVYKLTPSNAKP